MPPDQLLFHHEMPAPPDPSAAPCGDDAAFPFEALNPAWLAPGEDKARDFDPLQFDWIVIRSVDHPRFAPVYARLWDEFGPSDAMETRDVIAERFAWRRRRDGAVYEMMEIRKDDRMAAVRDHSAVLWQGADGPRVLVHLSHLWIAPEHRRTGLTGWCRTVPIECARRLAASLGMAPDEVPIDLVAEMDHPNDPAHLPRLTAYERAGFKKVDPAKIPYHQPDFRPPAEIDASGGAQPLPYALIVRRVGREEEGQISGREARDLVERLLGLYGRSFRPRDMIEARRFLGRCCRPDERVDLLPPTHSTAPPA